MIISPPELITLKVCARVPTVQPHGSHSLVQRFLPKRSAVQQVLEDSRKLEDLHRAAFRRYQLRAFKQRLRRLPQKLQAQTEGTSELLLSAKSSGPSLIALSGPPPNRHTPAQKTSLGMFSDASRHFSTSLTNSGVEEHTRRTIGSSKPLTSTALAPLKVSERNRTLSLPDAITRLPKASLSPPVRWSSSVPY